jgi:amidohydrolase
MGLAIAKLVAKYRDEVQGTVKLVFQPAEEGLGGAFAMIAEGVLNAPRPDVAFAMHMWTPEEYGNIRVVDGPCLASSSVFTLTVQGRGGHGAAPHLAVDPVLAAAHIVAALQSIVSRNVNPQESVVVSVGEFKAGTTFNVIPDKAFLKGTVRSYNNELHRMIYRRILEMATRMAEAFNCTASMETIAIVQAVVNAPEPTAVVRKAVEKLIGPEHIIEKRTMASEDMGFFLDEIPGCYFFVGARNEERGFTFPHHHPQFNFDERAMINGVAVMAQATFDFMVDFNGRNP